MIADLIVSGNSSSVEINLFNRSALALFLLAANFFELLWVFVLVLESWSGDDDVLVGPTTRRMDVW